MYPYIFSPKAQANIIHALYASLYLLQYAFQIRYFLLYEVSKQKATNTYLIVTDEVTFSNLSHLIK